MKTLLLLACVFAIGCATVPTQVETPPQEIVYIYPEKAWQIDPPEIYRIWFEEVLYCLEGELQMPLVQRNLFEDITWYIVPGDSWVNSDSIRIDGAHYPLAKRIDLAETKAMWASLVKHELIHYILVPMNTYFHPAPPFHYCELK